MLLVLILDGKIQLDKLLGFDMAYPNNLLQFPVFPLEQFFHFLIFWVGSMSLPIAL